MPVRKVNQFDRRDSWPQSLDIPLPHVFLWTGIEEHRMPLVSSYACLKWQMASGDTGQFGGNMTYDHQRQAVSATADAVHPDFLGCIASIAGFGL